MARPKGTYVSQVFNFGVDKTIPFGFVDLVIDRSGNTVGFEKDGKFYNPGDKVPAPAKKALTSDQLDKKKSLLNTKLALTERQASATNIGETERNRYIAEFKKTQDELAATEQAFVETQIREGKIKKAEAEAKVAETIRFDLDRLEERKNLLARLGKPTTEVDTIIQEKNSTLSSLQANIQPISGPDAARQGMPSSVLPKTPALGFQTGFKAETPTTPAPGVPTTKAPSVPGIPKDKPLTDAQQREEALNVAAGQDFALPETIFNNVDSLKRILERYVKEDWTPDKLRKAIRDDVWFRKNSAEIKARYVQLYNYQDLVKTGQAQGTTDYEKQIATLERQITDKARAMGSGIASDPAALRKAAENMYITNVGIDDAMTTDFIAAAIRPIGSTIAGTPTLGYSGQALKDYQELQSVARANGFKISDIIPGRQTEEQVLQGIATGRIDANRIAQDARRLAAQGRPEYVRDLLSQGYNLDQVYSPYRQTMANILELNPDQINLDDPALQMGITDTGDMNLYDFKKSLRKDSRWQYTSQAKEEVSSIALKVLRDFGFQG